MAEEVELGDIDSSASEKNAKSTFKKIQFIDLPEGQSTIRVLSTKFYHFFQHYFPQSRSYVKCLEDDCPICLNNRKIIMENPETFRDVKGFNARKERWSVNVLDRTLVKICPKCGAEIKKVQNTFPATCTCNTVIVNEPEVVLNKVKVLSKGKMVIDDLKALNSTVLDEQGTPLKITEFDIVLHVKGKGIETNTTLIPMVNKHDIVELKEDELFDLSKSVIELTPNEILDVQRGVSIRDIFAARKVSTADVQLQDNAEAIAKEVEAKVAALMGQTS